VAYAPLFRSRLPYCGHTLSSIADDHRLSPAKGESEVMGMPGKARLLSLLGTFASGRTFSAAELAADFAVTARTIRRDIAELRALGYIIASVPGTAGGYRAESRTMLPPLQLGSGEALATAVGLALLRGAGLNTPHADSAARKLSEMLP